MPHPKDVQSNLESQFKMMDDMYAIEEQGVSKSSDDISPINNTKDNMSNEEEYVRNLVSSNKKEVALKSLMQNLDALGQIM